MKLQYLGHSSFIAEIGGKRFAIDPFISPNPNAASIDVGAIRVDYVLLSHGHGDHVADAEAIAKASNATIISNYEVANWYAAKEITTVGMNHGGKFDADGVTIKYVNAVHTSSMPDGSYGGNPGGFVIWTNDHCFYFAGDTALTTDMSLIPMTCPPLQFAILPVGDHFTMGYEDAVIASDLIKCNKIVACHFDTFPPIAIDQAAATKAFQEKGKQLIIPEIGQDVPLAI